MKLQIRNAKNEAQGDLELPAQFNETVRADVIKRAVFSLQSNRRQKYGAHPRAGMRAVAELSRRRRKYRGSYGFGISRVQRKIMSRRGRRFNWVGAVVPGTVGGRRAHPAKACKDWGQSINKKENRLAIRSAISATVQADVVKGRGHRIPKDYPFVVADDVEKIAKTKDLSNALVALGLGDELARTANRSIRAGKGKMRGRKYKTKIGPLLVIGDACDLEKAGKNLPGVTVVKARELNAELLAPGAAPGRITLWTKHACEVLAKEGLFL